MSQHDMLIADQEGAPFLADLNGAIEALSSNSSGTTEPATTKPYQWWADTTTFILKQRNSANSAWVSILDLVTGKPYATGTPSSATFLRGDGTWSAVGSYGLFYKADPSTVAFTKTGAGTASIKAGSKIDVAGTLVEFASATAITMPTLTVGSDYAIWVKDDATLEASTGFTSAPGAGNWRKIGGFHYAAGSVAAAQAGGDTTPQIIATSFWDLKFRPRCDPRGMTLDVCGVWVDAYILNTDHITNGTSKYNATIADGSNPPKIPIKFGGNGSTAYSSFTRFEAAEVLASHNKRLPTYAEFCSFAYGTTEATSSGGSDVPTTGVSGTGATNAWNKFTSHCGVFQASGCMWIWGAEFGGGAAGAGYVANTGGRGSTYQMENAVIFGGSWGNAAASGSRASTWSNSPAGSNYSIGARGVCDHLILD